MANERDNNKSFYGMRLVSYDEQFIGICCELVDMGYLDLESLDHDEDERKVYYEVGKIALRFYYKNEYKKYVYDELKTVSIKDICTGKSKDDALSNLRKIAKSLKLECNVFIDEDCYQSISKYYKNK